MRPDAIPVSPLASHATLTPDATRALFGKETLRGRERVEVVRHGDVVARVPCASGALGLHLDRLTHLTDARGLRLVGPVGVVNVSTVTPVRSRLLAPAPLARAWGLGESGTLLLGPLAVSLPVETGDLALRVEAALWAAAGRPQTARWAAGLTLPVDAPEASGDDRGPVELPRRVVTETDVRQAMLGKRTLRLRPDQIVTPAARSLGDEHGVFSA